MSNEQQPYHKCGIIHKGYRYLYLSREWTQTDQYERWDCDLHNTVYNCPAYLIRDSWCQDEERIKVYGTHNHPVWAVWEDYYGLLYDWKDDNDPYPKFDVEIPDEEFAQEEIGPI